MPSDPSHLSRISTMWTMLVQAHGQDADAVQAAQGRMMERYSSALYRYLLKLLRNADAADEVFQEFALKFVRGDYRHANPARGRFRDYLKVSILRLVNGYRRRAAAGRAAPALEADLAADDDTPSELENRQFVECCREELLNRAWAGLRAFEDRSREISSGQPYHAVLDFRSRHPDSTSEQAAARLSEELRPEKPFTPQGLRKILQRAREKFAQLLLWEVRQLCETTDRDEIEQTLIELGLAAYCRPALERWNAAAERGAAEDAVPPMDP